MITDGTETIRAINIENFTGANAIITEAGMPSWLSVGPDVIQNAQTKLGNNTAPANVVIGAVNKVVTDPFDPNVMWAATVGGGIWRNNDRTVFFATAANTLDVTATTIVDSYATFLKANPGLTVTITGFTDATGTVAA